MDNEILDPIYKFLDKPDENCDFKQLMSRCLNAWIEACDNDYQYCTSMEYFIEESQANDWEYTEDGRQYF